MINNILGILKDNTFLSIFTAISSDPSPPQSWSNIFNNIYFRFIFIFMVVYQVKNSLKSSLLTSTASIIFYYIISTKEEREKILKDNHNMKDLETVVYFVIFTSLLYYLEKELLKK